MSWAWSIASPRLQTRALGCRGSMQARAGPWTSPTRTEDSRALPISLPSGAITAEGALGTKPQRRVSRARAQHKMKKREVGITVGDYMGWDGQERRWGHILYEAFHDPPCQVDPPSFVLLPQPQSTSHVLLIVQGSYVFTYSAPTWGFHVQGLSLICVSSTMPGKVSAFNKRTKANQCQLSLTNINQGSPVGKMSKSAVKMQIPF